MSPLPKEPGGTDTRDEEILADLFDTMLQEILEGNTPDLAQYHPDRPDLGDRIHKTWALACSVAGRREPSRPVLGGYEIVRELGHGGMGTVYLARHQALQRDVAIKVLPHSLAMSARAKQRFLEEAKALAKLRHDHVVHIHRIIDHAEMLAFEMEYIDGPSLQSLILELRQQPKPHSIEALAAVLGLPPETLGTRSSVEWFVRVCIRIARALGEVHRHGLVHRDVKPSNILLRADGRPVLADFGLARIGDLQATQSGGFAGTPVYAAPERLRGGDGEVDARADVYSLAVSLYEALTLHPPFAGSTTHEVLRRIENGHLPALRKQAPHVSRDLETVLGKAMEVDPKRRYDTADAFADDLERLLSLQPILARPAGAFRSALKFARRHQRVVLAGLVGALLVSVLSWPMLAHASALETKRQEAAVALHHAREQLLSPDSLHAASMRTFLGTSRQPLRNPSSIAAQVAGLEIAQASYAAALAADPAASSARLEHDVVAAVLAIRAGREDAPAPVDYPALPPLAQQLARALATEHTVGDLGPEIGMRPASERFAAGLLAFLLGDQVASHACWAHLDQELTNQPLLDACMALQLASDGFPERAYPRLFHAVREFPNVASLSLAIADAALAMGDIQGAENWLGSIPEGGEEHFATSRRRLLQADLLAATGHEEDAANTYRKLSQADSTDPVPVQRLAALAAEQGDHDAARRLLNILVARWPDLVTAHLELARIALVQRDLPAYLSQARYALHQDLSQVSHGTASHLAEILRLGGLRDLCTPLLGEEPLRVSSLLRPSSLPLSDWLSPQTVAAVKSGLRTVQVLDACWDQVRMIDAREVSVALRSTSLAVERLPGLSSQLPLPLRLAVQIATRAVPGQWVDRITMWLVPYGRTLGSPLVQVPMKPLLVESTNPKQTIFANQILIAGDTDGDTLQDVVVANPPTIAGLGSGSVEIRSRHDGTLLRTLRTDRDDCIFARSIAVLGDIDGDLCNDILIGMPSGNTGLQEGTVELRSGRTGAVIWTISRDIVAFGVALVRVNDLDGDGKDDFVVGASPSSLNEGERGRAFVCSGATGAEIRELVANRSGVWFGGEIANAGDVDGDGKDDVLVGGNFGNAPGLVTLYSGATGAELLSFGDDSPANTFGFRFCSVGDADGDGRPDIAISAPGLSSRNRLPGKVQILSSHTGKVLVELMGERDGDGFGTALCAIDDWTRRKGPSIAVASRRGGPIGTGYVRIFAVRSGSPEQTFAGTAGTLVMGYSLAFAGDSDGDGFPELLVPLIFRDSSCRILPVDFSQTFAPKSR